MGTVISPIHSLKRVLARQESQEESGTELKWHTGLSWCHEIKKLLFNLNSSLINCSSVIEPPRQDELECVKQQ